MSFLYCAPHTFHQGGDIEGIIKYAGPFLTHVHIADTLTEVDFDGIACVCVFAWEERARESSAYNLEQIRQYLAKHGGPPG